MTKRKGVLFFLENVLQLKSQILQVIRNFDGIFNMGR